MNKRRKVLLVEDTIPQLERYREELQDHDWDVIEARLPDEALYKAKKNQLDAAMIDLGLIYPGEMLRISEEESLERGINLIGEIRIKNSSLPILAYTGITPSNPEIEFAWIIKRLLVWQVSFVYTRELSEHFGIADYLNLVWKMDFVLSPSGLLTLPNAVTVKPDPLNDDLWDTLKELSEGRNLNEVASKLENVKAYGVKARIKKIKDLLIDIGELQPFERDINDLVRWYHENRIKYSRFDDIANNE